MRGIWWQQKCRDGGGCHKGIGRYANWNRARSAAIEDQSVGLGSHYGIVKKKAHQASGLESPDQELRV